MALVRKTGYANSADAALHPAVSVGDYIAKNRTHDNSSRFYIAQNELVCTITNNGGDALVTDTAHGLTTGDPVRIKKSAHYNGYYKANVIDANTFKLTELDGTTLAWVANETNSFWVEMFLSHDEKNFSLGINSHGKACYDKYQISADLADFGTSYAYQNHNSDGTLRDEHGNVDNYTGPIGNRFWLIYEDITVPITDSSGDALGTLTGHGIPSGYVVLKTDVSSYATRLTTNHWYLEVVDANTFKFRENVTGAYMPYNGNADIKFSLCIDACKIEGLDVHGSSTNPVIITNTDGQAVFRRSSESVTTYGYELWGGAQHFRMTGEYDPVLGTGDINYRGRDVVKDFYDGLFGIEFQFESSAFNNTIFSVGDGANYIELDHYRTNGGDHGFAGTMCKTDGYSNLPVMYIIMHDAVITDTHGEGCYIGNTGSNTFGSPQLQHAIHLTMYNMIFARTGVEIQQTGQLWPGSHIYNNVFFLGSMTRHAPFFVAQSTEAQLFTRAGGIMVENNIYIGGGVQSITIQTDVADEVGDGSPITVRNCVFQDCCGRFLYYNNTNTVDSPIRFEDIWLKRVTPYDTDRNESQPTFDGLILENDITTQLVLNGLHIDSGMSSLNLNDGGAISTQYFPHVVTEAVDDVEFVNNGYNGVTLRDVYSYFRNYNAGHPTHSSDEIDRGIGETLLYNNKVYKSLTIHTSNIAPDLDATNYVQLWWDVDGKRSDDVDYNGTPYSRVAPLDFRLVANNFFNIRRMGIFDNPINDDYLSHYWQSAVDDSGSPDLDTIKSHNNIYHVSELEADLEDFLGTPYHVRRVIVKDGVDYPSNWYII